eukprot:COSAG04_NODE_3836_length_2485_cov_1.255658_2_plen_182_part_00
MGASVTAVLQPGKPKKVPNQLQLVPLPLINLRCSSVETQASAEKVERGWAPCCTMAHLLAPTATNPIIHRDLTQSELPYGQRRLGLWGAPLQLPLRTGVWELDAHVARRDALQRSAAGTALLGQAMDLELDGEACRCRVLRSRYAASGALEYQLLPLGAVGDVLGAHPSEVNRLFRRALCL